MGLAVAADNYTYTETNYAPTAFFNGSATTTYAYDAIGHLKGPRQIYSGECAE